MMEAYGEAGEALYVREKGGYTKLLDMLDEFADNAEVNNATMSAIAALALGDVHGAGGEMMELIVPKIFGPLVASDVSLFCSRVWLISSDSGYGYGGRNR